jgi:hypothetical protein
MNSPETTNNSSSASSQASRHTNKKTSKAERERFKYRREAEEEHSGSERDSADEKMQENEENANLIRARREILKSLLEFVQKDDVAGFKSKLKKTDRLLNTRFLKKSLEGVAIFHASVKHAAENIFRCIVRSNPGIMHKYF